MENDFGAPGAPLDRPMGRDILPKPHALLAPARKLGRRVITTPHGNRRDGCDRGLYGEIRPPIAARAGRVGSAPGIEISAQVAPAEGHRVSLGLLGLSTAHVMTSDPFIALCPAEAKPAAAAD